MRDNIRPRYVRNLQGKVFNEGTVYVFDFKTSDLVYFDADLSGIEALFESYGQAVPIEPKAFFGMYSKIIDLHFGNMYFSFSQYQSEFNENIPYREELSEDVKKYTRDVLQLLKGDKSIQQIFYNLRSEESTAFTSPSNVHFYSTTLFDEKILGNTEYQPAPQQSSSSLMGMIKASVTTLYKLINPRFSKNVHSSRSGKNARSPSHSETDDYAAEAEKRYPEEELERQQKNKTYRSEVQGLCSKIIEIFDLQVNSDSGVESDNPFRLNNGVNSELEKQIINRMPEIMCSVKILPDELGIGSKISLSYVEIELLEDIPRELLEKLKCKPEHHKVVKDVVYASTLKTAEKYAVWYYKKSEELYFIELLKLLTKKKYSIRLAQPIEELYYCYSYSLEVKELIEHDGAKKAEVEKIDLERKNAHFTIFEGIMLALGHRLTRSDEARLKESIYKGEIVIANKQFFNLLSSLSSVLNTETLQYSIPHFVQSRIKSGSSGQQSKTLSPDQFQSLLQYLIDHYSLNPVDSSENPLDYQSFSTAANPRKIELLKYFTAAIGHDLPFRLLEKIEVFFAQNNERNGYNLFLEYLTTLSIISMVKNFEQHFSNLEKIVTLEYPLLSTVVINRSHGLQGALDKRKSQLSKASNMNIPKSPLDSFLDVNLWNENAAPFKIIPCVSQYADAAEGASIQSQELMEAYTSSNLRKFEAVFSRAHEQGTSLESYIFLYHFNPSVRELSLQLNALLELWTCFKEFCVKKKFEPRLTYVLTDNSMLHGALNLEIQTRAGPDSPYKHFNVITAQMWERRAGTKTLGQPLRYSSPAKASFTTKYVHKPKNTFFNTSEVQVPQLLSHLQNEITNGTSIFYFSCDDSKSQNTIAELFALVAKNCKTDLKFMEQIRSSHFYLCGKASSGLFTNPAFCDLAEFLNIGLANPKNFIH